MAKFEDLAVRYMIDLIRDFKLLDFQAAAIPGNGGHESGGFTQLQELHPTSGRGGLGHFQDTGPRRVAFEEWLARNADKGWTAATYEANYSFLFRELIGAEHAALEALRKTTTLEEATEVFCDKFERPGVKSLDSRINYARRALTAFKAAHIDPSVLTEPKPAQEILSPLPKIDFNVLLPLILNIVSSLQKGQQSGSGQPDVLSILGPILQQLGGSQPLQITPPQPTVIVQPPPVTVATEPVIQKPSVQLSVAGLGITSILQAIGVVGTPFGMGQDPTLAGTLSTIIPIASALLGMTGGWGAVAGGILKVIGPGISALASSVQKK